MRIALTRAPAPGLVLEGPPGARLVADRRPADRKRFNPHSMDAAPSGLLQLASGVMPACWG